MDYYGLNHDKLITLTSCGAATQNWVDSIFVKVFKVTVHWPCGMYPYM